MILDRGHGMVGDAICLEATGGPPYDHRELLEVLTMGRAYNYAVIAKRQKLLAVYLGWVAQKVCHLSHAAVLYDQMDLWRQAAAEVDRLLVLCCEAEKVSLVGEDWQVGELWPALIRLYGDGGWWTGAKGLADRRLGEADRGLRDSFAAGKIEDGPFYPRLALEESAEYPIARDPLSALDHAVRWLSTGFGNLDLCRMGAAFSSIFHHIGPPLSPVFVAETLGDLAVHDAVDREVENRFRQSLGMVELLEDRTRKLTLDPAPMPPPDHRKDDSGRGDPRRRSFDEIRELGEDDRNLALACVFKRFGAVIPPLTFCGDDYLEFDEIKAGVLEGGQRREETEGATSNARYVFRRETGVWRIRFGDESGTFKALDGFAYIHHLIQLRKRSGRDPKLISALDLKRVARLADGPASAARSKITTAEVEASSDEWFPAGKGVQGSGPDTVADRRALGEVSDEIQKKKREIADTQFDIKRARSEEKRKELELKNKGLQKELEQMEDYIHQGRDHRKNPRRTKTHQTKAREAVRQAIKTAYEQLLGCDEPMNDLVTHLKRSIPRAIDGCFFYNPEKMLDWHLD